MPGLIHRNVVVKFFGQPQATEGSVNEPREREEHGWTFNEKWTYKQPPHDPQEAAERVIYWHRYDYVGSVMRKTKDGDWVRDDILPQALERKA